LRCGVDSLPILKPQHPPSLTNLGLFYMEFDMPKKKAAKKKPVKVAAGVFRDQPPMTKKPKRAKKNVKRT